MRLIIEEYQYNADDVRKVLSEIGGLENIEGKVSINYVGYFYNRQLNDVVFILPKVLLVQRSHDEQEYVFTASPNTPKEELITPEEIIDVEKCTKLTTEQRSFIYHFAVWIYRAIVIYHNDKSVDTSIVYQKRIPQIGGGRKCLSNTYLDIVLSLIKFNEDNQNFLFYILRNIHSGFNKINWTKTISHSSAIVQKNKPIYLNPVNKKRKINYDEELLILFFSILNYLNEHYGFSTPINVNFELITGKKFEAYRKGLGMIKLRQIKYKYFSDKALKLWWMCYDFFEQSKKIVVETGVQDYLLVKDFNIVFEAMIDNLIGDKLPKKYQEMKEQPDGKLVDHMYNWYDLTTRSKEEQHRIFYIGDSKYYKRSNTPGKQSWYKQFTYARNVIQWNLDLFLQGKADDDDIKLRDETTEGYNIIPNFFISATINDDLSYEFNLDKTERSHDIKPSMQFENRLFDRDTLLVCYYDVNFLFIVSLYGRNNYIEKNKWKEEMRDMFRKDIQNALNERYQFYAVAPKPGTSAVHYIEDHFQQVLGKVYNPYQEQEVQRYFSLALDKADKYKEENEVLVGQLEEAFYVEKCKIGDNPEEVLKNVEVAKVLPTAPKDFLTLHYLERYKEKFILVGCYHDQAHLDWILGKNDKNTLLYNVRLGKERDGSIPKSHLDKMPVEFVVIYEFGHESENNYRVFRVHHHASMKKERMKEALYPDPKGDYFCSVFSEEVSLGNLDINKLISRRRLDGKNPYVEGAPIFVKGEELIEYRK